MFEVTEKLKSFYKFSNDPPLGRCAVQTRVSIWEADNQDYLNYAIEGMLRNFVEEIIPHLNKGLYIRPVTLSVGQQDFYYEFILSSEISVVNEKPVIYKFVNDYSMIPKDYNYCKWCGGHTKNDKRGHCGSCGGPRIKE